MRGAIFAALAAGLMLGACDRVREDSDTPMPRPSTIVEAETRVDTVAQEEPGVARSQWRATSDQARAVAGNLRVSIEDRRGGPVVFAFANGVTIRAQPYDVVSAGSRSGVGSQSFAAVLGGDPRVDAHLYRVITEQVTQSAVRGGLCGAETRSRHLAVSEFVDGSGRWVFKIAAFRGDAGPSSGADPELCDAYAYMAQ
ncbi:MAG: hypothetical protein AB7O98_18300 [Hyphomonadaceae bacterium]